jgi:hypothetical protein
VGYIHFFQVNKNLCAIQLNNFDLCLPVFKSVFPQGNCEPKIAPSLPVWVRVDAGMSQIQIESSCTKKHQE